MTQRHPSILPALALLTMLLGAANATADWLVTKEGARVETRGAWKVKGKLVVFTTTEGKLSSLRVTEVDLDASRDATEEAVAASAQAETPPEPEKVPERRKSVRVITDKDVRQGPASTAKPGLEVVTWKQQAAEDDGHVVIAGLVQNPSESRSIELALRVMLFDGGGNLIASSQAAFGGEALPPGETISFRADFPGFFAFDSLQFEPRSKPAPAAPSPSPAGSETGGPGR